MRAARLLPAALAVLALAACSGMPRVTFGEGADNAVEEKTADWQEEATTLPAAPVQAGLVTFYTSPLTPLTFAVDTATLAVGKDGVVRYTLVATAPGGARNVSHEGLHCKAGATRAYGFSRADGSWTKARSEAWKPISQAEAVNPRWVLAREYFCQGRTVDGSAQNIVRKLRAGQALGERA